MAVAVRQQVRCADWIREDVRGRLPERVASAEWGPEAYSYGRLEFALRDPDGTLVIFSEATDDPPTTTKPEG